MGAYCLVVEFEIRPEAADRFVALVSDNARASLADEPGCRQFDVLRTIEQPNRIVLYEVYADAAAFAAHMKQPHVEAFFAAARPLIVKQTAHRLERAAANLKAGA